MSIAFPRVFAVPPLWPELRFRPQRYRKRSANEELLITLVKRVWRLGTEVRAVDVDHGHERFVDRIFEILQDCPSERLLLYRELVVTVQRRHAVAFGQRRIVERVLDEIVDRPFVEKDGLTDVYDLCRSLAYGMDSKQPA